MRKKWRPKVQSPPRICPGFIPGIHSRYPRHADSCWALGSAINTGRDLQLNRQFSLVSLPARVKPSLLAPRSEDAPLSSPGIALCPSQFRISGCRTLILGGKAWLQLQGQQLEGDRAGDAAGGPLSSQHHPGAALCTQSSKTSPQSRIPEFPALLEQGFPPHGSSATPQAGRRWVPAAGTALPRGRRHFLPAGSAGKLLRENI